MLMETAPVTADAPVMLSRQVRGRRAWDRASLARDDFLVGLDSAMLAEIDRFVSHLRANPLQTELLDPRDADLPATRTVMQRARCVLDRGAGFALLDRLPVDRYAKDELKAVYWVLSSMISRPVAQAFRGTMLYDVRDTGAAESSKVRGDLTRQELTFHTDYGYNEPPQFIGLQVLRTAKAGGHSAIASLLSAHNVMLRRHPGLLARLYRPFHLNRYGEHAPGLPPASFHPVFAWDGRELRARYNRRNIYAGYELMGETLDAEGQEAIETLHEILQDPDIHYDFDLEAGQVLYIANWRMAHRRTEYEDFPEPDRQRHLVRIFLRDRGRRSYDG